VARAQSSQDAYLSTSSSKASDIRVAYFCAEFGVDASLPIYSGGLGILAGDHLKASSDAALPLVAVGLLYHGGYLRQSLDANGRQTEGYPRLDMSLTGLYLVQEQGNDGAPLRVAFPLEGRTAYAQVWCADIGRIRLYLLDTDIPENTVASDHEITERLYGAGGNGERDMRIRQEIVLGIAGVRALRALGYAALDTFHLNEGHAAFLLLELLREARAAGASIEDAMIQTRKSAAFTTHTPVPAGHDRFAYDLLLYYLGRWSETHVGLSERDLIALGGPNDFSMTELALNLTRSANGVSAKHGEITRAMFPYREVGAVTNGVHHTTWTGPYAAALYDKTLLGWRDHDGFLRDILDTDLNALRGAHAEAKKALIAAVNERYPEADLKDDVLTLGFARRMTGYKRATLLFRDAARLAKLGERGLQVIVAGKAHPRDEQGKDIIREIVSHGGDRPVHIVFVEGYDMTLARHLVAGVDVWLNTPLRPLEASGTSGMKALHNGVPNLSVLDGWWIEGFSGTNGWAIGSGYSPDKGDEDSFDASSLYSLLENEVLPEYYDRSDDWLLRMARAVATAPQFSAQRMVEQYAAEVYGLGAVQTREATPA